MKQNSKFQSLASKIILTSSLSQKAIIMLLTIKTNMYLFFSGVFVSISLTIALDSINLIYDKNNLTYIILHYLLILFSFLATLILTWLANLSQNIDKKCASEYCRLIFDENLANEKKNEFENSLKDAFNITNDIENKKLKHVLRFCYIVRLLFFIFAIICIILIICMTILNQTFVVNKKIN